MESAVEPRADRPWPTSLPALWRLLDQPRAVDAITVHVACTTLLVGYALVSAARHRGMAPDVWAIRIAICAAALFGRVMAARFTWTGLRLYSVVLALLLPLGTAYVGARLGNEPSQMPFTGIAMFVPMVFLLTATDYLIVGTALVAGNIAILALMPPPAVPFATLAIVLGVAVSTGMVAGVTLLVYRAQLDSSLESWRDACARERTLREFAQLTAANLADDAPFDRVAARFGSTFADGAGCIVFSADLEGDGFRVAGAAGLSPDRDAFVRTAELPANLVAMAQNLLATREPLVVEDLGEAMRSELGRGYDLPVRARSLVALPVAVEGVVTGAVAMFSFAPRPVGPHDLALWRAMADQLGTALANTRLLARLQQALRAKSEFLNTMSHELRSPLHVITGYAEMLRDGAGVDPAALALRIRTSALELLQLVENTMNVARLDAGKVTLHVTAFAPADVLGEVAESVRALPEAKDGVPVRWAVAPDLPRVELDRLKLKEIVQNLVSNALKWTTAGEVTVIADCDDRMLRLAIRDTGCGIPPDAQARIFELFERVERPEATHRPAGVGLGLYIVKSLVELMDGRIALESTPGRGSTFTVRLPLRLLAQAA